jgi:hypothetical protein
LNSDVLTTAAAVVLVDAVVVDVAAAATDAANTSDNQTLPTILETDP